MNPRSFTPLAVVALVVLAGCTGTPGSTDGTPTPQGEFVLRVENAANESFTVTVHLATDLAGVVVTDEDGRTDEFPGATAPGDLPAGALDGAVRIDPIGNVTDATAFTGPDGEVTITTPYDGSPRLALYAVATPGEDPTDGDEPREIPAGELREWNVVTCPEGSTIDALTLRITADATSPSFGCDY